MRVLWLAKGLGQGGMERLLVTHAKFGDRKRFEYHAAYLVDRPYSVMDELERLHVPVTRLGSRTRSSGLGWLIDLVRLVKRERIDVVHTHSPMPAAMARPVLRVMAPEVRLIHTEHNTWDRYAKPTRWANMITFPFNDRVFAVSDDCRDSVPSRLKSRVEILIHGIDVETVAAHRVDRASARAELGVDDRTVVIGTVANLRPQKNYPLLLRVAAKMIDHEADVAFVAVGQGPLEAELKAMHERLGLGERFRFLGFRFDVHSVMSAFDVFCLSSDHEGLPVALMEAKALGLPVVATSVGGVPSVVEDGVDGLLVAPQDVDALEAALNTVCRDSRLRQRMALESSRSVDDFDARRAISVIESAYGYGDIDAIGPS